MLKVKWFYRKQDIPWVRLGVEVADKKFVGDNEVFMTNHTDRVFADSIHSKCKVMSIAEYDELGVADLNATFFTRATFDA